MSDKLSAPAPANNDQTPVLAGEQAALFDDPRRLLDLPAPALAKLDALFVGHIGGVMPGIRRMVGLMAWAHWHRDGEGHYGTWETEIAVLVGVNSRTVTRWRDTVVSQEHLRKPAAARLRSEARKGAGQGGGHDTLRGGAPSPAAPAPPALLADVATAAPQPPRPLGSPPPRARPPAQERAKAPLPAASLPSNPDQRGKALGAWAVRLLDEIAQRPPEEVAAALARLPGGTIKSKALMRWAATVHTKCQEAEMRQVGGSK